MKNNTLTLANRITFLRILAVPFFVMFVIYYKESLRRGAPYEMFRYYSIALFGLAILLDLVDGYVARKRKEVSKLGSVLDPLADKALLISGFILLSGRHMGAATPSLPVWFVILIISRDATLIFGSLIINFVVGSLTILPRFFGRASTFFQVVVIALVLLKFSEAVLLVFIFAAALCTIVSGIQYFIDGIKQLDRADGSHPVNS